MESNTQPKPDLLVPRFKVKASWPDMGKVKVGDTICIADLEAIEEMRNMNHLFREMEWWEERYPEDMPKYVRKLSDIGYYVEGDILKVADWQYLSKYTKTIISIKKRSMEINSYWLATAGGHKYHAQELEPATEFEIKNAKQIF